MSQSHGGYYLPDPSHWPITGSIGLFSIFVGAAIALNGSALGPWVMAAGTAVLIYMLFGWFGTVIGESVRGTYNKQVDTSFRWGMFWFIFSEVMFFAAFFGALFYARVLSVEWLGGAGKHFTTHQFLWPEFVASWPMSVMPDPGKWSAYTEVIPAVGVPLINTVILLSSSVTVTIAHHALKAGKRSGLCWWLFITLALGFSFVVIQAYEYIHAYEELGLTLNSGIYGTTFFMLTGFHGLHVTIGATMLTVIWLRSLKGHFTPENHFGFEAVAWYWHFVDVVWVFLFTFVYFL
ncbi:MAG TPA: cytochrome c oxidase subunit 3 [Gammaproteobacteria bacterium]|jgi:cytochrome c oxidase subunit 3